MPTRFFATFALLFVIFVFAEGCDPKPMSGSLSDTQEDSDTSPIEGLCTTCWCDEAEKKENWGFTYQYLLSCADGSQYCDAPSVELCPRGCQQFDTGAWCLSEPLKCQEDTDCDDGLGCTEDLCVEGSCSHNEDDFICLEEAICVPKGQGCLFFCKDDGTCPRYDLPKYTFLCLKGDPKHRAYIEISESMCIDNTYCARDWVYHECVGDTRCVLDEGCIHNGNGGANK